METKLYLDLNTMPKYLFSGFRYFLKGEHHINRFSTEDIIIFVFSGVLRFSENGVETEVKENEYYIQPSGTLQAGTIASDEPVYFFCHFDGVLTDNVSKIPQRGVFDYSKIYSLANKLHRTFSRPESSELELHQAFYSLLLALNTPENTNAVPDSPIVKEITTHLQEHYTSNFSLDKLSKELHYSKDYIIREFKKKHGVTPYKYVMQLRILHAEALLLSSNISISDIATASGFSDVSNFYRAFEAKNGCSPRQFKIQNNANSE